MYNLGVMRRKTFIAKTSYSLIALKQPAMFDYPYLMTHSNIIPTPQYNRGDEGNVKPASSCVYWESPMVPVMAEPRLKKGGRATAVSVSTGLAALRDHLGDPPLAVVRGRRARGLVALLEEQLFLVRPEQEAAGGAREDVGLDIRNRAAGQRHWAGGAAKRGPGWHTQSCRI